MEFVQLLFNGIVLGAVYALFAEGFAVIFGTMGVLDLAHGAVLMFGAFLGLFAVKYYDMPIEVAFIVAMAGAGVISLLVEQLALRPLRGRGGESGAFAPIVTTLGAAAIIEAWGQIASHTQVLSYPTISWLQHSFRVGRLYASSLDLVVVAIAVVLGGAMILVLQRTQFGIRVRAMASDLEGAQLLGVNSNLVSGIVYFVAGALAGAVGVLVSLLFTSVQFEMGQPILLVGVVVLTIGGLGSVGGALIAGLGIGIIESLVTGYINSNLSDVIVFLILVGFLTLRPTGLFGTIASPRRASRS